MTKLDSKYLNITQDVDFNNFKSIAMACDNGTSFPASPVTAQWFYRTDIDMLFIYEAEWKPIISFSAYNIYVNGTTGSDSNDGYSSGTAVATITKAWNKVAALSGGNVIIYISSGTYNESVVLGGKLFTGSYSITFQGEDFSTITPTLTGTADSFTQGVGGNNSNYPAPASLTDTGNFTGVDYTGYFFEGDDSGVYKVIHKNDDDSLTINDISYSSVTNYKLYTLTTIWGNSGSASNFSILPGQQNLYFNHIRFNNTTSNFTLDQQGAAYSEYTYCQVQGGNNTRGCRFTNTTCKFNLCYVYNTYNYRSCIATEQGTLCTLTNNVFYNSGTAGYGLRIFGPAFIANGGDMSCYRGSGGAYYAARLGGAGTISCYRVYLEGFSVCGIFAAHEGFLLYESETFMFATSDIPYKQIYGRSASNAPIGWSSELDLGNSGTTKTIKWSYGNKQKITLDNNCTFTFDDPENGVPGTTYVNGIVVGDYQLKIIQDATGSRTITWPSGIKWVGGSAPTLSTGANAVDIIEFYFDGTDYWEKNRLLNLS